MRSCKVAEVLFARHITANLEETIDPWQLQKHIIYVDKFLLCLYNLQLCRKIAQNRWWRAFPSTPAAHFSPTKLHGRHECRLSCIHQLCTIVH